MMNGNETFYAVGLSYKKADAELRGKFSLSDKARKTLLDRAKAGGHTGLMAVSTCNRTDLYGFAQHPYQLIKLLCDHTEGDLADFEKAAYVLKNNEAVSYIFEVGAGLDSQILGDFEITSQLKSAFKQAKKVGLTRPYTERLLNSVLQAGKRVRTETGLSSGAASVSFAAVQYILDKVADLSSKNILLFGAGKIGRNTCENLVKHIDNDHITLINRTSKKAENLAGKFNLTAKNTDELPAEIQKADILIVATGASRPTITKELIAPEKKLLILDLSIPHNVAPDVVEHPGVSMISIDDLSRMKDETLEKRKAAIPRAKEIIDEVKSDFDQWVKDRKFAPAIQALKDKLNELKEAELDYQQKRHPDFNHHQAQEISDRLVHKITTRFANYFKNNGSNTESGLEMVKRVFELDD